MPSDDPWTRFVDFGRWEEAHKALAERVDDCEDEIKEIKDAVTLASQRRVNRQWQIVLALLTAFLLPLLIYVITLASHSLGH